MVVDCSNLSLEQEGSGTEAVKKVKTLKAIEVEVEVVGEDYRMECSL